MSRLQTAPFLVMEATSPHVASFVGFICKQIGTTAGIAISSIAENAGMRMTFISQLLSEGREIIHPNFQYQVVATMLCFLFLFSFLNEINYGT